MRPWNHAVVFVEFDSIREGVTAARSSLVTARVKMRRTMTVRMMMVVVVVRVMDGADDDDGDHKSRVGGMG